MVDGAYITIQSWMRKELGLTGNDLLVYAIIYGFSQDGESEFTGSLQYLADWCGATKQGISKNLKSLVDKGYIRKTETTKNHVKFCSYSCIPYNKVVRGIQQSCINNIEDNKDINTLSKDKVEIEEPVKPRMVNDVTDIKPKRKSLYDKCVDEIYNRTDDPLLQESLRQYLNVRLAIKEKPIYGVNQWIGLLNRLFKMEAADRVPIVQQSIENGWCSFYELKQNSYQKSYQRRSVFGEDNLISTRRVRREDIDDGTEF